MRLCLICLVTLFVSCTFSGGNYSIKEPEVVPFVDLSRYVGIWYEISKYPNRFQEGCVGTSATYTLREDGNVSVLNQCYEGSFKGKLKSAKGIAKVVDKKTNAKLKVSFFRPFYGEYWIIDLDKDYEYAVVSNSERKYLWVLSREKTINEETYLNILKRLEAKGFDINKLQKTLHR